MILEKLIDYFEGEEVKYLPYSHWNKFLMSELKLLNCRRTKRKIGEHLSDFGSEEMLISKH